MVNNFGLVWFFGEHLFFFLFETDRARVGEGQRESETHTHTHTQQNPKQAPGSELSAESLTRV